MIVKLHSQRLQTVDEIRSFLDGATTFDFEPPSREENYQWLGETLRQLTLITARLTARRHRLPTQYLAMHLRGLGTNALGSIGQLPIGAAVPGSPSARSSNRPETSFLETSACHESSYVTMTVI